MSPCLLLWHRFKPSHIIRESRASLLCLWGFPSQLYNDLPVGLFWCWRRSLPANPGPALARLQSKQNPLCPRLCFWHQLFVHDSSSWLLCFSYTAGFFFLHHRLFFFLLSLICFSGLAVPSLSVFLCLSFCLICIDIFFQLLPEALPPHTVCRRGC